MDATGVPPDFGRVGALLAMGGTFDPRAVLTPQILGALIGLAALSLATIALKAHFARKQRSIP